MDLKQISKFLVSNSMKSDEALIKDVVLGNERAFTMLYERYKNRVFNYTLRITKDEWAARELAQDTLLKVYKNADRFDPTKKFSTWLWTIARNSSFDYLKRKDALRYTVDLVGDDGEIISVEDLDKEMSTPEKKLIDKTKREELNDCIERLKDSMRDALMLRVKGELSYDEISEISGLKIANVKTLINRAKQSVIKCMREKEKQEGNHE